MPIKTNDLIIRDVWNVAGFDIQTGKPIFYLTKCNNTTFNATADMIEITGGKNAPVIASYTSNVKASLNVESAVFDLALLGLQSGDDGRIVHTSVNVPVTEDIVIPSTSPYEVTLKKTPSADGDVSILLDNGVALIEGQSVDDGTFTVSGKKLTFASQYAGLTGKVFYDSEATEAVDITIATDTPTKYCTVKAEITAEDPCTHLQYLGYIVIYTAAVDRNFAIEASKDGNGSVHNVIFNAQKPSCSNTTALARIVVYSPEDLS